MEWTLTWAGQLDSLIWTAELDLSTLDKLPFEKLHNRFCKHILGIHKKASNFTSECELGREPIINFINVAVLQCFQRLQELPTNPLLGEVFIIDKSLAHTGYRSWFSYVQKLCRNLNLEINESFPKTNSQHI